MQTIRLCRNWVVGGGPPCKLPIGNGTCKCNNSTQKRGYNSPCHTVAPAGVIADLGNGPEDSEYEALCGKR